MQHMRQNSRRWVGVPPWIIIGTVVILLPIFAYMAAENIQRHKRFSTRLLVEKGAALIRSFEAGTRTGMMGVQRSNFRLQKLLVETAQQPDIVLLLVADGDGNIIAHNDPQRIGQRHAAELDLHGVLESGELHWREVPGASGQNVFEVFRRFKPTARPPGMHHGPRMRHMRMHPPKAPPAPLPGRPTVIFVGFDTQAIEAGRQADTRHTLIMAAIMLLAGFAGVMLLWMGHNYRATRKSLSEIQAFSNTLVGHMPIGLIALDAQQHIVAVNPVAESILQLTPGQIDGVPASRVLPPIFMAHAQRLNHEKEVVAQEIECPIDAATSIPIELSASHLKDASGASQGWVLLFKDLREVRELRQEIERNRRLATVGQLAAGVAHEIRNPLSSIKGFATYFKERYGNVTQDRRVAQIMVQEVERLNKVVSQLLAFSRPIPLTREPTALQPLIEKSLTLVAQQAQDQKVEIIRQVPPENISIPVDADRISQVLLNLYLNALAAMPNGGRLSVTVSPEKPERRIEIAVTDTGHGIQPEDRRHIFDPYFTTKPAGTGLGLAIVHNIIRAHQGEIRAESVPGQGTRMRLFLPLTDSGARHEPTSEIADRR